MKTFLHSKGAEPEISRSRSAGRLGRWSAPPPSQLPPMSSTSPPEVRGSPVVDDPRGLQRRQSASSAVVTVLPQISQRRKRTEDQDGEKSWLTNQTLCHVSAMTLQSRQKRTPTCPKQEVLWRTVSSHCSTWTAGTSSFPSGRAPCILLDFRYFFLVGF